MFRVISVLSLLFLVSKPLALFAEHRRIIYSRAGVGTNGLPEWAAKDLGLFDRYGLNVELVVITGGARGMQALLGGSTDLANIAAMAPIRTVIAGGDVVIVGAVLNKNLLKFVARKDIRKPSELRGKKIGVANFGGSNEFGAGRKGDILLFSCQVSFGRAKSGHAKNSSCLNRRSLLPRD